MVDVGQLSVVIDIFGPVVSSLWYLPSKGIQIFNLSPDARLCVLVFNVLTDVPIWVIGSSCY